MAAAYGYIPRQYRNIPHVSRTPIPGEHGSGGGSERSPGNPLANGTELEPYSPPGQWLNDIVNQKKLARNQARLDTKTTADQEKVQAGVDAYQQALEKTGDPKMAFASVFHTDSNGHVHFQDPPTFNAILALHQAQSSANQGQGNFETVDLGNHLMGVRDPNGKYSVHHTSDLRDQTTTSYRTDEQGRQIPILVNKATGTARDITTEGGDALIRKEAPAQKQLPTTKAQTDQLQDIQTVLDQVQKMRNTAQGATGSFGWGSIERGLAMHTGLGGKQAETYNEAYNEMAPALTRLLRVPGQAKLVAQLAIERLPKPGNATAFTMNETLPGIEYGMRQQVANLYQTYKLENRVGGREMARSIAQTYEAHPDQMKELEQAKLVLRSNPGQMSKEHMDALWNEAQNGRLSYDDWTREMRQAIQRKLILPQDFDKAVAASPDLAQISPEEHTDPSLIPQGPPPGMPVAPIPPGAAPGPVGAQMAPQVQNPQQPPSPQPAAFPEGGNAPPQAQQGDLHPPMGGQPQPPTFQPSPTQGQPLAPPASAQQQDQLPEQIQQQAEDQSPGQNNGFLGQLMQHLPTALQNLFGSQQPPTTGQ